MLTQQELDAFDRDGYLLVKNAISAEQLAEMRAATAQLMDQSRAVSVSDHRFDLDEGHGPKHAAPDPDQAAA